MKIAIVTPFGAEERLDRFPEFVLASGLVKRGHDVRFYTFRIRSNPAYARPHELYKGVDVTRCFHYRGVSPLLAWRIIRTRPSVVVLCHIRNFLSLTAYLAARFVGAKAIFMTIGFLHDPFVVADRDNPIETIFPHPRFLTTLPQFLACAMKDGRASRCWENYLFHAPFVRADRRVTFTEFERDVLQRTVGLESVVIRWGVPPPPERAAHVGRPPALHAVPDRFLLYVGQVKKRKGWDTMVEALALLKQEGIRRHLVFVTSSDPIDFREAETLVRERGLADQITFLFKIPNEDKEWLLAHADGLFAPSRYESIGLPVFEAFAAGTPVLGTDIPVYRDFLVDGVTGLVSMKGDPRSLADNVKHLADPSLRARVVEGGKKKVLEYSEDANVEHYLRLIDDMGQERPRPPSA